MLFDEMTGHSGPPEVRESYQALARWLAEAAAIDRRLMIRAAKTLVSADDLRMVERALD